MRTNSKEVKNKVFEHISDEFEGLEYEGCETLKEKITSQIDHMRIRNETVYMTAVRMVQGGTFLIYNGDILEFINDLNLNNNSNKVFDTSETFKLYCHLLGSMIESIYTGTYKAL